MLSPVTFQYVQTSRMGRRANPIHFADDGELLLDMRRSIDRGFARSGKSTPPSSIDRLSPRIKAEALQKPRYRHARFDNVEIALSVAGYATALPDHRLARPDDLAVQGQRMNAGYLVADIDPVASPVHMDDPHSAFCFA